MLVLAACQDRPATQVVIGVATDLEAPDPLLGVEMKVERLVEGLGYRVVEGSTAVWPINRPGDGVYELPSAVVAFATADEPPEIRVTLSALDAHRQPLLRRRAVLRLQKEKTLFLRLGLTGRCLEDADCGEGTTCLEGRCRDELVDAAQLPSGDGGGHPELGFACDSGTRFRNTRTGQLLPAAAPACPRPEDVCSEGVCYHPQVFSPVGLPRAQNVTLAVLVSNAAGAPITGVELRVEDGPVSLVRQLRGPAPGSPAPETGGPPLELNAVADADPATPGLYRLDARGTPLTTDLRLTVKAPGHAPQVVSVPYKAGVTEYLVPVVLFPMLERMLTAGEPRALAVAGPDGSGATLVVGGNEPARLRYALLDARFAPGQGLAGSAGGLLASRAVIYLENLAAPGLPDGTEVSFGVRGPDAAGTAMSTSVYALDLQGRWRKRADASAPTNGESLRPGSGGFWTVGGEAPAAACVRGDVVRVDRKTPCAGARVHLFGPAGAGSFDTVGADGSFCGLMAAQQPTQLTVGKTTRMLPGRVKSSPGQHCSPAATALCPYLGKVVVDDDKDCTLPQVMLVPGPLNPR